MGLHAEILPRERLTFTYFEDAEGDPMPRMLTDIAWEQVQADIRTHAVKAIAAGFAVDG